jgi:FAD/FMN-containing dehydrogenase
MDTRGLFLSGWGRTARTPAHVVRPRSAEELIDQWDQVRDLAAGRGVVARGLGRSYGDPAQNAGGVVVDMSELTGLKVDAATATAEAEGGVSLDALEAADAGRPGPFTDFIAERVIDTVNLIVALIGTLTKSAPCASPRRPSG